MASGIVRKLLYGSRAKETPLPRGAEWSKGSRLQRFFGTSQEQKGVRYARRQEYKSQKYKMFRQRQSQVRQQNKAYNHKISELKKDLISGKRGVSEAYKKYGIRGQQRDDPADIVSQLKQQKRQAERDSWAENDKQLKKVYRDLEKKYSKQHNPNAVLMARQQLSQQRSVFPFTGRQKTA